MVDNGMISIRECAGLVKQHRIDLAHPLEREAILHRIPAWAEVAVDIEITSGMASPSA